MPQENPRGVLTLVLSGEATPTLREKALTPFVYLLEPFLVLLQTQMTDFPILSYTSTNDIPTPGSLPFCLYTWNLKKVPLTSVNLMLCISVSGHSSETTIYLTDVGYKTLETRGLGASWILLSSYCHSGLFTFQYTSFRKLRFRDQ